MGVFNITGLICICLCTRKSYASVPNVFLHQRKLDTKKKDKRFAVEH